MDYQSLFPPQVRNFVRSADCQRFGSSALILWHSTTRADHHPHGSCLGF